MLRNGQYHVTERMMTCWNRCCHVKEQIMTCKVLVGGGRMWYLDAVDVGEPTSDSAIERVVLGRVVELIEILLVQEALFPRRLDPLRAVLVISLGCPVGVGLHCLEGVDFGAESHELSVWVPSHLILHLPDHRLIRREPRLLGWVGRFEIGHV